MEEELMERNPATELEILLGAVNGLVDQDKRLKELETKTAQADEEKKWRPMQKGWLSWITPSRRMAVNLGGCR